MTIRFDFVTNRSVFDGATVNSAGDFTTTRLGQNQVQWESQGSDIGVVDLVELLDAAEGQLGRFVDRGPTGASSIASITDLLVAQTIYYGTASNENEVGSHSPRGVANRPEPGQNIFGRARNPVPGPDRTDFFMGVGTITDLPLFNPGCLVLTTGMRLFMRSGDAPGRNVFSVHFVPISQDTKTFASLCCCAAGESLPADAPPPAPPEV